MSTKLNGDEQYAREPSAGGSFPLHADHGEPIGWATAVILHLKDQTQYLGEAGQRSEEALTVHTLCYHPLFGEGTEKEIIDNETEEEKGEKEEEKDNEEKPKTEDVGSDEEDDSRKDNKKETRRVRRNLFVRKN